MLAIAMYAFNVHGLWDKSFDPHAGTRPSDPTSAKINKNQDHTASNKTYLSLSLSYVAAGITTAAVIPNF